MTSSVTKILLIMSTRTHESGNERSSQLFIIYTHAHTQDEKTEMKGEAITKYV